MESASAIYFSNVEAPPRTGVSLPHSSPAHNQPHYSQPRPPLSLARPQELPLLNQNQHGLATHNTCHAFHRSHSCSDVETDSRLKNSPQLCHSDRAMEATGLGLITRSPCLDTESDMKRLKSPPPVSNSSSVVQPSTASTNPVTTARGQLRYVQRGPCSSSSSSSSSSAPSASSPSPPAPYPGQPPSSVHLSSHSAHSRVMGVGNYRRPYLGLNQPQVSQSSSIASTPMSSLSSGVDLTSASSISSQISSSQFSCLPQYHHLASRPRTVSPPASLERITEAMERRFEPHPQEKKENKMPFGVERERGNIEITLEPLDCSVAPGERVVFMCRARLTGSSEEPSLLWYHNDEPLIGEIDCEYVIESASEEDEGHYFCLAADPSERFLQRSRNARLILQSNQTEVSAHSPTKTALALSHKKSPPEVETQPKSLIEAIIGEKLRLVISASGSAPLAFKWYKDTRELMYANGNVLELPSVNLTDAGRYCCALSNDYGSILSDVYLVKVARKNASKPQKQAVSRTRSFTNPPPPDRLLSPQKPDQQPVTDRYLKQVADQVALQISNWSRLALYLGISNSDVVSIRMHFHRREEQAFQLLRMWRDHRVPSSATPVFLHTILTQAGVSLSLSNPSIPLPGVKPIIVQHPQDCEVIYGQTASLAVRVEKIDSHTSFQWYRNGQPLSGKVNLDLVFYSAIDDDAGCYFCRVSNKAGYTDSTTAQIIIKTLHSKRDRTRAPVRSQSHDILRVPIMSRPADSSNRHQEGYHRERLGRHDPTSQPSSSLPTLPSFSPPNSAPVEGFSEKPTIVEHPRSQEVEPGEPMTLRCVAMGPGTITYLWYFNGLSLQTERNSEYHINCFTDEDEGLYACETANENGRSMSVLANVAMKLD